MTDTQHFDVVIMGAGMGGNWAARHLMIKIPGIRVALVEPKSDEAIAKIGKIGESSVEIAGIFMVKELGLGEYLTEHHLPKNGLNFHWPKDPAKTDSTDDYWSVWALRQPVVHAWQMHRGKLERDLLRMNTEMGATRVQARVTDIEVTSGDGLNTVIGKTPEGEEVRLSCDHLIDCAGRSFITGRKFDNILAEPEDKFGLNNGTAWVRITGVDRELFHKAMPIDTATARYYGTNHWFGEGHWLWMIPIDREEMSLSIGVMHHHDVIPGKHLNSRAKFLAFLEKNHGVLHKLITSADAELDFMYWGKPSHRCKEMFSKDNWYAVGDAAYFADAFYSMGTSTIAVAVESVTEIIRAKRAGEADAEEKRQAYNDYNIWFSKTNMHMYRHHGRHLGDPSIMSWRIFFEYVWWFGTLVPTFIGKWHLQPKYIKETLENCPRHFHVEVYDELNELQDAGVNLGLMDCYRADQLAVAYHPTQDHLHYLENTTYGPRELNIYTTVASTHWFAAWWWIKLQKTAYGFGALRRKKAWSVAGRLFAQAFLIKMRAGWHELELLGRPQSDVHQKKVDEFARSNSVPKLQPWMDSLPERSRPRRRGADSGESAA
jgi:flavin-dependent dehydrogenase